MRRTIAVSISDMEYVEKHYSSILASIGPSLIWQCTGLRCRRRAADRVVAKISGKNKVFAWLAASIKFLVPFSLLVAVVNCCLDLIDAAIPFVTRNAHTPTQSPRASHKRLCFLVQVVVLVVLRTLQGQLQGEAVLGN